MATGSRNPGSARASGSRQRRYRSSTIGGSRRRDFSSLLFRSPEGKPPSQPTLPAGERRGREKDPPRIHGRILYNARGKSEYFFPEFLGAGFARSSRTLALSALVFRTAICGNGFDRLLCLESPSWGGGRGFGAGFARSSRTLALSALVFRTAICCNGFDRLLCLESPPSPPPRWGGRSELPGGKAGVSPRDARLSTPAGFRIESSMVSHGSPACTSSRGARRGCR